MSLGNYPPGRKISEEGNYVIFKADTWLLIDEPDNKRAFIIQDSKGQEQVFWLFLPKNPKPKDWTEWQCPDFFASNGEGKGLTFYDQTFNDVSTKYRSDSFELRYKVHMRDVGPLKRGP